jgi:hypothetical protein
VIPYSANRWAKVKITLSLEADQITFFYVTVI